jgi:DNA-binding beta-propeller fold protein YncE
MTMSPNGKLLYVVDSSQSNPGEPSAITPVDTATDTSAPAIKLARNLVPFSVSGLAFMSNSATAYAITSSGIVPINTATGRLGKTIGLRTSVPVAIAVTRDNSAIAEVGVPVTALEQGSPYANNVTLALLSTRTGVVGKVATLGDEPGAMSWEVAIAPNGSSAYVLATTSSPRESTVIPVDLATGTAGKTIDVGRNASMLAISPNGATVFVLDSGTYVGVGSPHNTPGRVIPIATSTSTVGKAITVGFAPAAFAIAPTGQK